MEVGVGGVGPKWEIFKRRELTSEVRVECDERSHFCHFWSYGEEEVTDVDGFFDFS